MSLRLQKLLDPCPAHVSDVDWTANRFDYRNLRTQPWWPALRGSINWIRMWADWARLQPDPNRAIGDPASPGYAFVRSLDAQIKQANADGLNVLLVPWKVPRWLSPVTQPAASPTAPLSANYGIAPQDRGTRADHDAFVAGQLTEQQYLSRLKSLEYRFPTDTGLGPTGQWGGWIKALWARYHRDGSLNGRVSGFEVVNEPNLQGWPQRTPAPGSDPFTATGTSLSSQVATAAMMQTMDAISASYGRPAKPLLFAPSISDFAFDAQWRLRTTPLQYPWGGSGPSQFVPALLDELDRIGFRADARWCWSYHTYGDVEGEHATGVYLRNAIAGRWAGAQYDGGPAVFSTEGGCRLNKAGGSQATQAQRVTDSLARMRSTDPAMGAGVRMAAQYHVYSAADVDSGLIDAAGAPRLVYTSWTSVPASA